MRKVHHLVLLTFQSGTPAARIAALFAALARLQERLPGIEKFCGGPYASPEGLNQGYTHGFLMTFASVAARDAYLTHPEHEQIKQEILPAVEKVVAFDFEE